MVSPVNSSAPSSLPFGDALAGRVVDLLARQGLVLWGWNAHWLLKTGDRFVYELLKDTRREVFATTDRMAFAAWLARQSPQTLNDHARAHCNDTVELITHELLTEAVATQSGVNDPTPFGAALANAVADALDGGVAVTYTHRDYCGMGLCRTGADYEYGPVYDGLLYDGVKFPTRAAFVAWLAAQSDASLAGREDPSPFNWDNQRITRARLTEAIAATGSGDRRASTLP
jgi:hypothetical protein